MPRGRIIDRTDRTAVIIVLLACGLTGCKTPEGYRHEADDVAYNLIQEYQQQALGRTEPFTIDRPVDTLRRRLMLDQDLQHSAPASRGGKDIEPIDQWPQDNYLQEPGPDLPPIVELSPGQPLRLTLDQALQVAARNSRQYQAEIEGVFRAALDLDLEKDEFRNTWTGLLQSAFDFDLAGDDAEIGVENTAELDLARRLKNGVDLTTGIALDLVKLLTRGGPSSLGIIWDSTILIPLLRGSGRFIVIEPFTQAQRDTVYAIYLFERFKREFAVRVARDYLNVLRQLDRVQNAEDDYRSRIRTTRRAAALRTAGRLSDVQLDQSRQDELSARNGWISAQQAYQSRLDSFKILLGLPTDAHVGLDPDELKRLVQTASDALQLDSQVHREFQLLPADAPIELVPPSREDAGPLELEEPVAIRLALDHRLDLRTAVGGVFDAQRNVAVSADALRADLTLLGVASIGERRSVSSVGSDNAELRPEKGSYSVLVGLDLPLERTFERNLYRTSLISLEQAVRDVQELEDQIKLDVRNGLRQLLEQRETVRIQHERVRVAENQVASTDLRFQAGRVEIRDVLEAQDNLLEAQNALTGAIVDYRVAAMQLQRDLGLLEVTEEGLWREYDPRKETGERGQ